MTDLIRMFVHPALGRATAIFAFEGWNDAGDSATTALNFINESIKAVPLADIDPETFYDFTVTRPEVVINDDRNDRNDRKDGRAKTRDANFTGSARREIHWPGNEFRYGSIDQSNELVTCIGVEPHLRWRCFCDCMSEFLESIGAVRVVLLGSYLADVVYSQPVQITGVASDETVLERIGVESSIYEGPTGILSVLEERFRKDGFETLSLWAGLPHYINARPNPRGALALVRVLCECLGLHIDLEPLERSAAEFEERISKLVSRDPELTDYVKQLKRREFAQ